MLPSGAGFDTLIPPAPPGDLAEFTWLIDGNLLSDGLKADINTTDPTRARFALNADETELAFDWMTPDLSTDYGIIAINSGGPVYALSSDAARTLRGYAPNTRNTAYGVSDTYGQYNAYAVDHYLPLGSSLQGRQSATSYATAGTITTGQSGLVGESSFFSDNGAAIELESSFSFNSSWSASFLIKISRDTGDLGFFGAYSTSNRFWADYFTSPNMRPTAYTPYLYGTTSLVIGTWAHVAFVYDAPTTTLSIYQDGVLSAQDTAYVFSTSISDLRIGYCGKNPYQYMQHFTLDTNHVSIERAIYNGEQLSDNSTFWSTPTWVSGGSGTNELEGTLGVSPSFSGVLDVTADLSGNLSSDPGLSGILKVNVSLVGLLPAAPLLSGVLTIEGLVENYIQGILQASPSLTGSLTVRVPLVGTLEDTASLVGDLLVKADLSGVLTASPELSGILVGGRTFRPEGITVVAPTIIGVTVISKTEIGITVEAKVIGRWDE